MSTPDNQYPYQDATLAVEQRVQDLLSRMTVEDKAGQMFQNVGPIGALDARDDFFNLPPITSMIAQRRMSHFNVIGTPGDSGRGFAAWSNTIQRFAAGVGLGIPLTLSSDPRHTFTDNPATAMMAGNFSQWPETLGLAAIGSEDVVEQFADIVRQEYLAVGLRVALHPQIDLATEPRWSRISGTFGEDADLTSRLVGAYLRGLQTAQFGTESVSGMVKHFPGGGPQKDGTDPHFPNGKDQIYPGHNFDYHLKPFIAALQAGARQMMPYYGRPIGTEYPEVGFGFNKAVLTGILREQLGFQGIICTDWGLLTDVQFKDDILVARSWGVENLSREEKIIMIIEAGADQFGGEICSEVLATLIISGAVSAARVDESVARLLREKFELGLFDDPYLDEERAEITVGRDDFQAAGRLAQSQSVTVLTNTERSGQPTLPLTRTIRLYVEGVSEEAASQFATVVATPQEADLAIIRIEAPNAPLGDHGFEQFFKGGSLEFTADERTRLATLAETVPLILDVYLDRPAILTDIVDLAAAAVVNYGCTDQALLDVLFGEIAPLGKLPFDLPRSEAAVEASNSDVPFDTKDPLFRFGHGLSLG